MKIKVLKEMLKQAWYWVLAYATNYLMPILMESLNKTKEYFISILWDSLKEQITAEIKVAVEYINKYFNSLEYKEKEKDIINTLFQNINLPFFLKPFKGLIKKILKDKIHETIKNCINKLNTKF